MKDEMPRLPWMLNYYRALGVEHFIIIDNESADDSVRYLQTFADVSVVSAAGSFKSARYGYDWATFVATKYLHRKWVLYVDADETFVWPGADYGHLSSFCDRLERAGSRSSQALLLDMYGPQAASKNIVKVGQDPLEVCRLFDPVGYHLHYSKHSMTTWVKGGLRGRLFFASQLEASPALNKTPLVQWRRGYAYLRATHLLAPAHLNSQNDERTSALLHFKFTQVAAEKVGDVVYREEHDREYLGYSSSFGDLICVNEQSAEYKTPADLVGVDLVSEFVAD